MNDAVSPVLAEPAHLPLRAPSALTAQPWRRRVGEPAATPRRRASAIIGYGAG